jgi:hypothetical protein
MKSALIPVLLSTAAVLFPRVQDDAVPGLDAASILKRAAKAQHGEELARKVTSVDLSLYLQVRDPDKGKLEFDVERRFQLPDMIWTRIADRQLSGTIQQTGFDGRQAWNHDERKKETIQLEGPDFRKDREVIQDEVKTMRRLLDFFFLENLLPRLTDLERLPDESSPSGDLHSLVVRARGDLDGGDVEDGGAGGPAEVTIWIEDDSYRLLGVRVVPRVVPSIESEDAPETSEQFCFWSHRPTPQGVVVPGSVKIYRDDEPRPSEVIGLHTIEDDEGRVLNKIIFNQKMSAEQFQPPGG